MANSLDSYVFSSSGDFYIAEFEIILTKIVCCYEMMIDNRDTVPNKEEIIRDILYNQYLNNNKVRNQIGLNFNVDCEPAEYVNGKCSGYVDLKFFSINSLTDTSAYYIIECKRLDNQNLRGITGLNAEYIKNGIMRFIDIQYSTNKNLNGLIGFIVKSVDIEGNIKNINNLLETQFTSANTQNKLTAAGVIQDFDYLYFSIHRRKNSKKNLKLYHLMLDFSKNIKLE